MRRCCLVVLALSMFASGAGAQNTDTATTIPLDSLRTPTSPAFTLLGVNPSNIARPTTPRALATELVSSSERGTVIPNSYAIEVAPYWLSPRPTLTFAQRTKPTAGQAFQQSFSLSLATARPDSGKDSASTRMALGARAVFVPGQPSAKFKRLEGLVATVLRVRTDSLAAQRRAVRIVATAEPRIDALRADSVAATASGNENRVQAANARLRALRDTVAVGITDSVRLRAYVTDRADTLRTLAKEMAQQERVGFFLEGAAAVVAAFADQTFDTGKFDRAGIWGTLTYRPDGKKLDLMTLVRFLYGLRDDDRKAIDAGARLHWSLDNLGLSSEWINRTAYSINNVPSTGGTTLTVTLETSSRAVGIVDYRAGDDMYITMSFGQDFKELGEDRHPLVAKFGMQFSYGKKPVVTYP